MGIVDSWATFPRTKSVSLSGCGVAQAHAAAGTRAGLAILGALVPACRAADATLEVYGSLVSMPCYKKGASRYASTFAEPADRARLVLRARLCISRSAAFVRTGSCDKVRKRVEWGKTAREDEPPRFLRHSTVTCSTRLSFPAPHVTLAEHFASQRAPLPSQAWMSRVRMRSVPRWSVSPSITMAGGSIAPTKKRHRSENSHY